MPYLDYTRVLTWEGLRRHGWIKVAGLTVELKERPSVLVHLMDFWHVPEAPQEEGREGREGCEAKRGLTPEERDEADGFLTMLAGGVLLLLQRGNRRR